MRENASIQNKAGLLTRIAHGRTALEQALNQLSEAQLVAPDPDNGWTIKDHLAHLAAWEQGMAALLQRQPRWPAMGLDEAAVAGHDMDAWNELIYRQSQSRSLAEVLAHFQDSHRQMLAAIAKLSEAELFKPYAYYTPDEPDDDENAPIINWIEGNTYEHYEEHLEYITSLLQSGSIGQ